MLNQEDNNQQQTNNNSQNQNQTQNIITSFLEIKNKIKNKVKQGVPDTQVLYNVFTKDINFNLETQRRGRRDKNLPDPQWDCAQSQISKTLIYLCEEEVSVSYQRYCKPICQQINILIESILYHDDILNTCQNLHMCPVTK
jgi:hypothetical protein